MYELLQKIKYTDVMMGLGLILIGIGVGWSYFSANKLETKLEIGRRREGVTPVATLTTRPTRIPTQRITSPTTIIIEPTKEVLGISSALGKINLNKAGMEELDKLPGIGLGLAKRIIEYREKNKGFKNAEEIKLVKGIGEKLFEKIKEEIEI